MRRHHRFWWSRCPAGVHEGGDVVRSHGITAPVQVICNLRQGNRTPLQRLGPRHHERFLAVRSGAFHEHDTAQRGETITRIEHHRQQLVVLDNRNRCVGVRENVDGFGCAQGLIERCGACMRQHCRGAGDEEFRPVE